MIRLVQRDNGAFDYGCGTCGSQTIILRGMGGNDVRPYWDISCGEGHLLTPIPGIWIEVSAG